MKVRTRVEPISGADPFAEKVFGSDDRVAVQPTTDAPWRWSAALRIKARDGKRFVGTGWFISPRTLVTAGHCVFMHDHGGFAESVEVIPALDGRTRPFGSAVARDLKSVEGWTKKHDDDFDYGAIVLDRPFAQDIGTFAFVAAPESVLQGANINIAGYPADRDGASRQYFHARKIVRVGDRRVHYHVDTFGGQSGSAAWITVAPSAAQKLGTTHTRIVVAIHTSGSTFSNFGTRITPDVVTNLKKWMA